MLCKVTRVLRAHGLAFAVERSQHVEDSERRHVGHSATGLCMGRAKILAPILLDALHCQK